MLARWSSWGALPEVFDPTKRAWEAERTELRGLLTEAEWRAAERSTINAHYTDPAIATKMWRAMQELGFDGGQVLEPGSGAGTFLGLAPEAARMLMGRTAAFTPRGCWAGSRRGHHSEPGHRTTARMAAA